jgi:hypothetical protein
MEGYLAGVFILAMMATVIVGVLMYVRDVKRYRHNDKDKD